LSKPSFELTNVISKENDEKTDLKERTLNGPGNKQENLQMRNEQGKESSFLKSFNSCYFFIKRFYAYTIT
jgi:hypothetical protein